MGATLRFVRRRRRWLLPAVAIAGVAVLPAIAFLIGWDLRAISLAEHGPNALADAVPWIMAGFTLVIGLLGFAIIRELSRREEQAERIAERRTAELLAAQDELKRALTAAQAAARAKDEFLAVMSHELRTPLNGVIGMTTLLLDGELEPQARDFAETARSCATGLLDVINDILEYSKLEAGRVELDDLPFDPRDLVEDVLQITADRAQAKGLELVGEVDPRLGGRLRGDASYLRQILLNLVGNAIKFTERGTVAVALRLLADDAGHPRLRLSVADTGIGIEPEALQRLFAPFTQADGSISRRFGGTGLGLAITKRLVEAMQGTLDASSEPGAGSVFTVELALAREPAEPAPPHAGLDGQLVLLVDDHAGARAATAAILHECGCEVAAGASLEEALAALAGAVPDLAVLDAAVPGEDPREALGRLRAVEALARVPAVLLTTFAAQLRQLAPGTATCAKPVRRRQLRDACRTALGTRKGSGSQRIRRTFPGLPLLVLDHRLGSLRLFDAMLREFGCRVDLAGDLAEALAAVRRTRHAAVFLAHDLPPGGAAAAVHALRAAGCRALLVASGAPAAVPAGCAAAVPAPPRPADLARLLGPVAQA